ncbi:hypothetical protein [Sporomusa malonica]|uniref:hypothetical protein n=1 Tax=Sporomusa malonica TaxID=112901 RepID=UPI001592FC1A|nr:hypothetical protein [Sporomusa malonica]
MMTVLAKFAEFVPAVATSMMTTVMTNARCVVHQRTTTIHQMVIRTVIRMDSVDSVDSADADLGLVFSPSFRSSLSSLFSAAVFFKR